MAHFMFTVFSQLLREDERSCVLVWRRELPACNGSQAYPARSQEGASETGDCWVDGGSCTF